MGVIAACLYSAGYTGTTTYKDSTGATQTDVVIAPWVVYTCCAAIGFGTLFGGWSIVGKMALDIYPKMQRSSGFCANSGAIIALSVATYGLPIGLPVSTTHLMNCAIVSTGVAESGIRAVQWKVMVNMLITWVSTIPCTIFIGFVLGSLMILPGGWGPFFCVLFALATLGFVGWCAWRQRHVRKETSDRIIQKYELHSTPQSEKEDGQSEKEDGAKNPEPSEVSVKNDDRALRQPDQAVSDEAEISKKEATQSMEEVAPKASDDAMHVKKEENAGEIELQNL